ncbi:MAG TPA: hypothetical protein VLS94_02075 [Fusibacter sp.]|nr:hypothetical protein [Fusibacter sp.]
MLGLTLIREIEDLLLDKLDRQENCLKFYDQIDKDIRQDLLLKIFDEIDRLEQDIQSMDLLFLSKFEKFKVMNGVDDINEVTQIETLGEAEKRSLSLIKKAIILIAQRERALDTSKKETQEIRLQTVSDLKKKSRENKAYSAYRNINK